MYRTSPLRCHHRAAVAAACWALAVSLASGAAPPQTDIETAAPGSEVSGEDASAVPSLTQQQPRAETPEKQRAAPPAKRPAESAIRHANVSRLLVVVGPLVAVVALMGLYWLILRRGAM